jgi:hypothetical protein
VNIVSLSVENEDQEKEVDTTNRQNTDFGNIERGMCVESDRRRQSPAIASMGVVLAGTRGDGILG